MSITEYDQRGALGEGYISGEICDKKVLVKPITTCHPETPFVVWPCNEKRRHDCCKGSYLDEGGREETSMKAHTEVDGQMTAERYERTPY